jgi:hypothetical protein
MNDWEDSGARWGVAQGSVNPRFLRICKISLADPEGGGIFRQAS